MSRPIARPPRSELATTGLVEVRNPSGASNAAPCASPASSPRAFIRHQPAVSRSGMIYATISGPRGKMTLSPSFASPRRPRNPFVTASSTHRPGLQSDGDLFVTSRAEGNVYRIDAAGEPSVYAEGMGVAPAAPLTATQPLRWRPQRHHLQNRSPAPHLRLRHPRALRLRLPPRRRAEGTIYVTGPPSLHDAIWAIDSHGEIRAWYRGLGRPQGLALSKDGDVYVTPVSTAAAALSRHTSGEATLVVSGNNSSA